jgi:NADPH:quinone reductase-like Zn-dependent oxidoreductase
LRQLFWGRTAPHHPGSAADQVPFEQPLWVDLRRSAFEVGHTATSRSARSLPIRRVSVVRRANVHGRVATGRRPGLAIGQKGETMRAVGLFTHGGPEVLQVVELPEVHAGPGQVRIRVHAATVNPTDVGARNGTRAEQQKADPPPYVPGMEAAGIVDEVGTGAPDRLKLGDAVMAIVVPKGSHGAYRERIVLDARSVVHAPAGKTHPEAATLPMNGLTARLSLDLLKLSPGQVIAVTGAAGAYGGYIIQLAKAEGLTVIADASEKDEKLVESLGADIVVRRGDDVASRIRGQLPSRSRWARGRSGA